MKTLYLIRHADSEWKNGTSDFDRSLSPKGLQDASNICEELESLNFNPTLTVCSPALRTQTTAEIIAKNCLTVFEPSIYESPVNNLIDVINNLPNDFKEVALIGHNPAISLLANYLTNDTSNSMQPCTVIKIELTIEKWNEITQGAGTEVFCISPEMVEQKILS